MEVCYNAKNGLSFITSKSSSKNLSNENKHCTGVFVVFKAKSKLKCQFSGNIECVCFHYWDSFTNSWHNNWLSVFEGCKKTPLVCLFFAKDLIEYFKLDIYPGLIFQGALHTRVQIKRMSIPPKWKENWIIFKQRLSLQMLDLMGLFGLFSL